MRPRRTTARPVNSVRVPRGLLLGSASGVAVGATFSPYGGALLPFLAFAPLGAALVAGGAPPAPVRATTGTGARPRTACTPAPFALGFTAAAIGHGMGLYWMIPALTWRTALAIPSYLVVVGLIGMLGGAACEGAVALRRRWRWPLPLALGACWTGSEWVAAHVPGFSYAWLSAGMSLGWTPALAAGSELLGARFLTFWTVAVGGWAGVACATWVAGRAGGRGAAGASPLPHLTRRTAAALALAVFPAVAGPVRQATLAPGEAAWRVAAVQPGRESGELGDWLEPLRAAAAGTLDFAAFPERFLAATPREPAGEERGGPEPADVQPADVQPADVQPADVQPADVEPTDVEPADVEPAGPALSGPEPTPTGAALASFAGTLGTPVLVGAMDAELAAGDTVWYNAAFLQAPGAALSSAYRKVRLVPGLEGWGWWRVAASGFGRAGYAAGRDTRPLVSGNRRVGVMVCYDSAFAGTARVLAREGAEWLAVLSNDDWLDPAREFRVTWAYWQHATHGRLRAIENRISLLQIAATGYTFAVPPTGASAPYALEPGAAGVAVLEARRRGRATLFTLTGDLLGPVCLLVFAASLLVERIRPRPGGSVEPRSAL